MSTNSILSQIKNNLEWLEIETSGKTWGDIMNELKERTKDKSPSLPLETIILINLFLKLEKEGEKKENGK